MSSYGGIECVPAIWFKLCCCGNNHFVFERLSCMDHKTMVVMSEAFTTEAVMEARQYTLSLLLNHYFWIRGLGK